MPSEIRDPEFAINGPIFPAPGVRESASIFPPMSPSFSIAPTPGRYRPAKNSAITAHTTPIRVNVPGSGLNLALPGQSPVVSHVSSGDKTIRPTDRY